MSEPTMKYPHTAADESFNRLMELQEQLENEQSVVGRARHEPRSLGAPAVSESRKPTTMWPREVADRQAEQKFDEKA